MLLVLEMLVGQLLRLLGAETGGSLSLIELSFIAESLDG